MIKYFHILALILYGYTNYYREFHIFEREMAARNNDLGKYGTSLVYFTHISFVRRFLKLIISVINKNCHHIPDDINALLFSCIAKRFYWIRQHNS